MTKNKRVIARVRGEAILFIFKTREKGDFKEFQNEFKLNWKYKVQTLKNKNVAYMHMYQLTKNLVPDLSSDYYYYHAIVCFNGVGDLSNPYLTVRALDEQGYHIDYAKGISADKAFALSKTVSETLPADLQRLEGERVVSFVF